MLKTATRVPAIDRWAKAKRIKADPAEEGTLTPRANGMRMDRAYFTVKVGEKQVMFTSDQVACLSAVSNAACTGEAVARVFGWSADYARSAVAALLEAGAIARDGRAEPAERLVLTGDGMAAIGLLRKASTLFDECCDWFEARAESGITREAAAK